MFNVNLYAHHLPKCPGEKYVLSKWVNCNGSYTGVDGHSYSGDFDEEGKYSGYGILKTKNGSVYEGEFFQNKQHGKGKQSILHPTRSKAWYEGEFFMGNWHGEGRLWSEDGSFEYKGEFQNYEMTGYGTLTWMGISVTGNWKDGNCNDKDTCAAVQAANNQ